MMDPFATQQGQGGITASSASASSSSGGTSYLVQVDPNSGHYEIVDSSKLQELGFGGLQLATATTTSSGNTMMMGGGGITATPVSTMEVTMGGGDETIYKIREEDLYFHQGGGGDGGTTTNDMEIDPAIMEELLNNSRGVTGSTSMQMIQPLQQDQGGGGGYTTSLIQQQQSQPQAYAVEEIDAATFHQHQQVQQQQHVNKTVESNTTTSSSSTSNGGISASLLQLISSFMTAGATAVQVENNVIIYNPSGQIVQIPMGMGQGTNVVQEQPQQQWSIVEAPQQTQAYPQQVQIPTVGVGVPAQTIIAAPQFQVQPQTTQTISIVPQPSHQIIQATVNNNNGGVVGSGKSNVIVTNGGVGVKTTLSKKVKKDESDSAPLKLKPKLAPAPQVPVIRPVFTSANSEGLKLVTTPKTLAQKKTVHHRIVHNPPVSSAWEDLDLDIKIVSCKSLAEEKGDGENENNSSKTEPEVEKEEGDKKEEKGEDDNAQTVPGKSNKENVVKDRHWIVKRLRRLPRPPLPKGYKKPNIPPWLRGYVDKDDELLIAFKHRQDHTMTEICGFCYSWFPSSAKLRSHVREKHCKNPMLHECTVCGARFLARILRIRHEKLHKFDMKDRMRAYLHNPWREDHYRKRFRPAPFSPFYKKHIGKICAHVQSLSFPCYDCGLEFTSSDHVEEHYDRVHASDLCGFCGKRETNLEALSKHEKEFHGHYEIKNNYEGGAFTLWEDWWCAERLEKEVVLSNIAFFHDYCKPSSDVPPVYEEDFVERELEIEEEPSLSYNFDEEEESEQETMEYNHGLISGEGTFVVSSSASGTKPSSRQNTKRTLAGSATGLLGQPLLPFACTQCPKSYDNEHDLKRHVKCHASPSKANLACQFCGRVFKTHSHKKEHERIHTGEKPYSCTVCSRSFIQSSNLKKHMQTHQQSSLQCSTCGKQFIKEASLMLHQRAHAQDRKFRCTICDRAYNYASLLKRHMRIHTGEMPYSCESCGMLFHELVSLHYHRKKVHTGERPHKCETCGRAFILSSDLKKHLQIHMKPQGEKPPSKPVTHYLRKRSHSKSTESNASSNQEYTLVHSRSSSMDIESPTPPKVILTSATPTFSIEDDGNQASNKPQVVRVYTRKGNSDEGMKEMSGSQIQLVPLHDQQTVYYQAAGGTYQQISREAAADAALLLAINGGDFTTASRKNAGIMEDVIQINELVSGNGGGGGHQAVVVTTINSTN